VWGLPASVAESVTVRHVRALFLFLIKACDISKECLLALHIAVTGLALGNILPVAAKHVTLTRHIIKGLITDSSHDIVLLLISIITDINMVESQRTASTPAHILWRIRCFWDR
jgi:hypothetical protein